MIIPNRLLVLASLATLALGAAVKTVVPPAERGQPFREGLRSLDIEGRRTDIISINSAIHSVHRKTGPSPFELPSQTVSDTSTTLSKERRAKNLKRAPEDFELIFEGTGTNPGDRDASIEGSAYLTHTLVSNATYNVDDCLTFCSNVRGCVFANLYYEFNNYILDFVAVEKSNLKCAVYGDVHTADDKKNFGGQHSYPYPGPVVYIQHSSGFALNSTTIPSPEPPCEPEPEVPEVPEEPPMPDAYEFVFGPTEAANDADGYLGFVLLDGYDTEACATLCNQRDPSGPGGACQYFNIWRAVVDGVPTAYTCALYTIPTDESTATYTGDGDSSVTLSRGYKRITFAVDGSFEAYPCESSFCFSDSSPYWVGTSSPQGYMDASIFSYAPYARNGIAVGLLGSATGADPLPGALAPASPLNTKPGFEYVVAFWQDSTFGGEDVAGDVFVEVLWNGEVVETFRPGYGEERWNYLWVKVAAKGGDALAFRGGKAPAWTFIDDVAVWQL